MKRPRLVQRHILDPRSGAEAAREPFVDAVNIPLAELPARTHELPEAGHAIPVAGPDELVEQTIAWLEAHGRLGRRVGADVLGPAGENSGVGRLWQPHAFLADVASGLGPGRALDIGCGCGREAVYLAGAGWRVTAVDILPDAIDRARALAEHCSAAIEPIDWQVADMEREPPAGRDCDLVICFRYLHRPLLRRVRDWLGPGGSFVLETFTTTHRERHGRPAGDQHVLRPGEVRRLVPELETMHASEDWRGPIHTGRLWARRPS